MSIVYGITDIGWVGKAAATIKAEIEAVLKAGPLGASAGTEPDGSIPLQSVAGQIVSLLVDRDTALWDLMQATYAAGDPGQATGASLDAIASITGTIRTAAEFSLVTITLTGTLATSIPAGKVVKVLNSAGASFATSVPGTLAADPTWTITTAFHVGDIVGANGNTYGCITAGTSAGSGTGPSGTSVNITDGTAHWRFIGIGTASANVPSAASTAGPIGALGYTLNFIATPVPGWQGAGNLTDAVIGQVREEDGPLRQKRQAELSADGIGTADAIRGIVIKVNVASTDPLHLPISSCTVFHNETDVIDANGVTPHSVEVLVNYPLLASATTDQDIANAIFSAVAAGIATVGTTTSTVIDAQGNSQAVRWSKPTLVPIYISPTVFYDAAQWPATPTALVQQSAISAVLTFAANYYQIGMSVRSSILAAAIMDEPSALDGSGNALVPAPGGSTPAPGILDVTPCYIGIAASPVSTAQITITARQLATFAAVRVVVTATAEAP